MKHFTFILTILLLFACGNSSQPTQKVRLVSKQVPLKFKTGLNSKFKKNYPNISYLEPGIFGAEAYFRDYDKLEATFLEEQWIGIFKTKNNWYLNPVKPTIQTVFDGIVDENEYDTANWSGKIMTTSKNCVFTLKKVNLRPKQLQVLYASKTTPRFHDEKSVLLPGDTLQFEVGDIHYWLYAKGKALYNEGSAENQGYASYALYLRTDDPGQVQQVQLLRSVEPSYEYGPNRLECLFVGLLDDDQVPDFIISSNFDMRILYISGEAKEQRIVEPVYLEPMTGGC